MMGARMSPSRRTSANCANAQRSTGPRSLEGKAQSRVNAFKHGLAIPAAVLPELAHDITELARKLAGLAADDPSVLQAAIGVVAAAVDVERARSARRDLLQQMVSDSQFHDPPLTRERSPDRPARIKYTVAMCLEAHRNGTYVQQREAVLALFAEHIAYESKVERIKLDWANAKQKAQQRARQWEQLARLERYERRAVSQRNTAIRAFDEAQAAARNDVDR
jgi:hypothetical protein